MTPTLFDPARPFGGTEGHAQHATSRNRKGVDGGNQPRVLDALEAAGENGLTWYELAERLGMHHGQASGVLSTLHHAGRVKMLRLVRRSGTHKSAVYVLPQYVAGRATKARRSTVAHDVLMEAADLLADGRGDDALRAVMGYAARTRGATA